MFDKTKIVLSFFVFAAFISGCDDSYVSSIPVRQVSLQLDLTSKYPNFKNSTNEYLLREEREFESDRVGFGGILVYSGMGDSGNPIYYAFDMACPYEVDNDIKVYPIEGEWGKVQCEACGSIYDVGYGFGNPTSGPAKEVLKKYKTSLTENVLYISYN